MLRHENFSETEALKMCHILLVGSCYVGVGEVVLQAVVFVSSTIRSSCTAPGPKAGAKESMCGMFGDSRSLMS